MIQITGKIIGIRYRPLLGKELIEYKVQNLREAIESHSHFLLKIDEKNKVAVSWWVSAKRTRSYPYARVYNTLSYSGKRITIIPFIKDEGKDGDRDFIQWDTISLMSLLGVYVVIAYYVDADKSNLYKNKITNQRFDYKFLIDKIKNIVNYQSDALHWNLEQVNNITEVSSLAINHYKIISKKLDVEMHSLNNAEKRIEKLLESKDAFMNLSRKLAKKAQLRESVTQQPKENLSGCKGTITIKNYLGGYYYFTADEVRVDNNCIRLVEAKHSKNGLLPSEDDIKDGLIKMILFTNLVDVEWNNKGYESISVLKLTSGKKVDVNMFNKKQKQLFQLLKKEAEVNNFELEFY